MNTSGKNKYTIAYLEQELYSPKSSKLWNGIVKTAKETGTSIIAFAGGPLGKSDYNIAYQLCNLKKFNGIISWATTENEFLDYYEKLNKIPFLSMSLKLKDIPYISIDCYSGMMEMLIHLVKDHNIKKIAFIRGPEKHLYANERYQAYLDIHKEYGLELDERRITPCGTWALDCGNKGIKTLLDGRNLQIKKDIEAVVCINDTYAIGAIEELKKAGFKAPHDVIVTGFNNSPDASSCTPPVTSVEMPHEEQGIISVKTIVSMLNGEKFKPDNDLPSKLVIHRSCGCRSALVENIKIINDNKNIKSRKNDISFADQKTNAAGIITGRICSLAGANELDRNVIASLSSRLVDAFDSSILSKNSREFIDTVEEILVFSSGALIEIEIWHEALSALRTVFFNCINKEADEKCAHDYLEQARTVISEILKRSNAFDNLTNSNKIESILELGSKLIATFKLENTLDILQTGLKKLGFPGFYLVLFDDIAGYKFPDPVPAGSNLILAYNAHDNINIKEKSINFPTEEILPEGFIPQNRNFVFFLVPLIFEKKHLGYMILEAGPLDKYIYSYLARQLSSSLMGAIIMEERIKSEKILEKTLLNLQNKTKIITTGSDNINKNVHEISVAMEEMANNIREISLRTEEVMKIVKSAVELTNDASLSINRLNENSKKISEISCIIDEIAQKTSILALNANIEAARAGDSGRGFKIVSAEIKKLSNLTVKSTKDIKSLVDTIQNGSNDTFKVIENIVKIIKNISDFSFIIKEAVSQQTSAANDVSRQLIQASGESKEIYEAIKEVAYTEDKDSALKN